LHFPAAALAGFSIAATRVLCALVILMAGVLKLTSAGSPAPAGDALVDLVAVSAPFLAIAEIAIALLLLCPHLGARRCAAWGAAILVGSGCLYLVWLRVVGIPMAKCGCFGSAVQLGLGNHMLLNGVLLGLLISYLAWSSPGSESWFAKARGSGGRAT